jgi:hypothetical protein
MKELRIYKTRPLARVAIMNFYIDNKPKIEKAYSGHRDQGIVMKDGTTIYFKTPDILQSKTNKFDKVTIY